MTSTNTDPKLDETTARSRRVPVRRVLLVCAVVLVFTATCVTVDALTTPGSEPPIAKLAEWARDHGLNWLVTGLEEAKYEAEKPTTGGTPEGGIPTAGGAVGVAPTGIAPMAPLAGGQALPGEGHWQTVVDSHGKPAVSVTTLRPDEQHTSYLAGVMRIDPTLVRGALNPGTVEPPGQWKGPTSLRGTDLAHVVAVFNGGFKLSDPSHNGYYAEGRTVTPLVDGKASLVLRTDGTADVGAWNSEVRMGPDVASVRQNLLPLVDDGQVNPTCATGGTHEWGSTIGQAAYIDRSGFGVTANGTEVYVAGPALSVCTLGRILSDAGVVRGMELDINPGWTSGAYFHDRPAGPPEGFKLFPAQQVPSDHYLHPTSRDWYSWFLRP